MQAFPPKPSGSSRELVVTRIINVSQLAPIRNEADQDVVCWQSFLLIFVRSALQRLSHNSLWIGPSALIAF
jgi:hypothetical protein